ncbi:MAG: NADH-quinone oxidoreductase subunit D [Deltaproteobacteria bacterium]|jgi:NADH-quinone oxidoreductase subunit C/D|nr:NADH-quinone oxidoreductase subunit D [Deltaproteobacteria bacterium]
MFNFRPMNNLKDFIERKFGRKMTRLPAHAWSVYGLSFLLHKENSFEVLKELSTNYDFHFDFLIDLTAIDWLDKYPDHRFELIYQLFSLKYGHRLSLKVWLPNTEELEIDSVSEIWKSALCLESEVWDMYGIKFKNHPDLRRILLYDEFEGHPLRKDYPLNKKQPRHTNVTSSLQSRELDDALHTQTMILNLGPSHPATHGTIRLQLELDSEIVQRCEVELGYLHRGFEKQCENVKYAQIVPYTDRLNYVSPIINNVGYCLAVEKLLNIEVPIRCQHIRVIMSELSRISDHLTCLGASAMELGAFTVMLYLMQAREYIYDLLEKVTGARVTCSYSVIGGVQADLPDGFKNDVTECFKKVKKLVADSNNLLLRNRIFIDRMEDIGIISKAEALTYGLTGPMLRACGVNYDVRKQFPYSSYEKYDFEIPLGEKGDNLDRFLIRLNEIEQSMKIVEQGFDRLRPGAITVADNKIVMLPKAEVYNSIEGLISQFGLVVGGIKPPAGEVYFPVEGGNGELGFYIVSDGTAQPYKIHVRPPCFVNIGIFGRLVEGHSVADVVAMFGMLNMIGGECDR